MSDLNRRDFLAGSLAVSSLAMLRPEGVLGANDRLGIGIIGCGKRGLLKEVLNHAKETNVEVRAICDTWRQQREAAIAAVKEASGKEPEQYVHYRDLLAMKGIDAVVIGTPDHQHCTILIDACRAGKDAYIEKPLAMDLKELHRAVAAVQAGKRVVQLGTQIRSNANVEAARAFVQSGGLGKIFKVEQSRNSWEPYWHSYGARKVQEPDVDWKSFLMQRRYRPFNADQYAAWYGYREFSRGPHTNLMVHFIDLVHFITGAKTPRRVVTLGGIYRWKDQRNNPDSVETILEYPEDGFLVRYNSTFGTSANSYMKFFGTRGVLDTWSWGKPFTVTGEGSYAPDKIKKLTTLEDVESTPHMKNWLECLRSRKEPIAPIEAGYNHSIAVIMADEALVRGSRVVYDPARKIIKNG